MLGKATRLLRRSRPPVTIEEPPAPAGPLPPSPPQLIVLVPNVVGIGSFKINTFDNVEAAAAFLPTVPQELQSGVLAFWALHKQPPLDNTALLECGEALIMLRSPADPQTAYVVSFVNIETAESFARFEVQRGLGLDHLLLYWASLVNIIGTEDGVRIHPSAPPDPDAPPEEAPSRSEDMTLLEAEIAAELRAKREEAAREVAEQAVEQAEASEPAPPVNMDQMQTAEGLDVLQVRPLPEDVLTVEGERQLPSQPATEQPDPRDDARTILNTIQPVDGAAFLEAQALEEDTIALLSSQGPEALTVTHQPCFDDVAAQAPRAQRVLPPEYAVRDGRAYLEVSPLPEDVLSPQGERPLATMPVGTQPDPRADARTVLNTIVPVDGAAFLQPQPFPKFAIALTRGQTPETLVVTHQPLFEAVIAEAPTSADGLVPAIVVAQQPARAREPLPQFEVVDSAPAIKEANVPQAEEESLPPVVVTRQPSAEDVTPRPAYAAKVVLKNKRAAPEPAASDVSELDAATMLAQVFASRRWQQQEKPFRGFDSPPGRF